MTLTPTFAWKPPMKAHLLVAKGVIALVAGIALGYGVAVSLAHDSDEGRALTMKSYMADFQHHKEELESSRVPMVGSILVGVGLAFATFLTYEALALGLSKVIGAIDRRTAGEADPMAGMG